MYIDTHENGNAA